MIEPIFQIKKESENKKEGIFVLEPLEAGYGQTLGNALRRVLLTSLPGAAVTTVKIAGVRHQFTNLQGLKEDIVELILNIKKLRIHLDIEGPVKIKLEATGPGEVTADQIKTPAGVEIVNKDLVLGNLADKKAKIECEMTVEKGYGYLPFEGRKGETLGIIPIDAIFTPISRVNYNVETTRVGRVANYDRLIMNITTDGTITPEEAMKEASQILVLYFNQIIEPKVVQKEKDGKVKLPTDVVRLTIEELSLPTRIANALEKNGYKSVGDLVGGKRKDIVKIKNLGEKSMKIIDIALAEKGVEIS
ncbi:MAG: DNA-directed RNA polymerase subunit alpha [bacterium]|nr:DNA-directed RNA polymerase subunit alpha [bacterium]